MKTTLLLLTLTSALAAPNPAEIIATARKHGQQRNAKAVPQLALLLKHKNERVRDTAWLALVRIGKPSVPALLPLTTDATELPGTLDDSYTKRKYPSLSRSRAPLGWRQIGPGKLYAVAGLHLNRYALRALGLIGDTSALPAIDKAEKKFAANPSIRDECRRARIALLGAKTPLAPGMRPWMLAEIGRPQSSPPALQFRRQANNNIAKKFGPYTDLAGNHAEAIRRMDTFALTGKPAPDGPLIRLVREGVRDDWQWFHAGMHDLVDHFHNLGLGWDGHWMTPLVAARALGESGARHAINDLKLRLNDKNILVRLTAARALARLGDPAGLPTALEDFRWMHTEFVSDYNQKGKPWLQHWINDDQSQLANENKYPGRTFFRLVPNYQYILAADTLGHIGNDKAKTTLQKRANELLALRNTKNFTQFYQVDLLWLAVALKQTGQSTLAKQSLAAGMELFQGDRALDNHLRHFHVAALPALARLNDPSTSNAVERILAHHQTTWRPGTYDIRDLAWGVYLTLQGRRTPTKPLRCAELCWLH